MSGKTPLIVRPTTENDRAWMRAEMKRWWGNEMVVLRKKRFYPAEMDGFIAESEGRKIGLIILSFERSICEIMSLTTSRKKPATGVRLLRAAVDQARKNNARTIRVVTTNDNIDALRFYQKAGFSLRELRRNAVEKSCELKPSIPETGNYGIPIRDEIELEMDL
jgi:N-acetylglutamate synthase-like GNAT family acetyltransferase